MINEQRKLPGLSRAGLIRRGLTHYWKINLTVLAAAAVGVAVLTGSLLVGGSMRASLRQRALDRLGKTGQVLVGETFFREGLAQDFPGSAAAITLAGSAVRTDEEGQRTKDKGQKEEPGTGRAGTEEGQRTKDKGQNKESDSGRAGKVQVLGVTGAFWRLGGLEQTWAGVGEDDAVLNGALARRLGARKGEEVLVRVEKPSAIPRETLMGARDDTVVTLRLRVAGIVEQASIADFSTGASQAEPLNIFVPLATLQRRLGEAGRANTLLVAAGTADAQKTLGEKAAPEDAGLRQVPAARQEYLSLESSRIFIPPYLAELTTQCAARLHLAARPTLTYLANQMRVGGRATPYSMVAALDDLGLGAGEIALNAWAAADLGAKAGDTLTLVYYRPLPSGGRLAETSATLKVARIMPMSGLGADPGLTPEFPGIKDATSLTKWNPPFPIELKRIRPQDEDYWKQYRAAPKAFVSLATGRALWRNPYGEATSIRVYGAGAAALGPALAKDFDPARAGLKLEAVRARLLEASQGASDFGGLFIGFSLFLLLAAAMLIRILFQLGVQTRVKEYGLLSAVGFPAKKIRRLMLAEGALIAAGGAAAGTVLGAGYAALMVYGLRTWWVGAIGTPFLRLHVGGASLAGGAAGGWLVATISLWLAARRLSRQPARALLAGRGGEEGFGRAAGRLGWIAGIAFLLLGLGLAAAGPALGAQDQAGMFFGAGAALLAAALAFFRLWLRRPPRRSDAESLTVGRLGVLAARRRPGRAMLVAGLMACATFIIVAVGANRQVARPTADKHSGAGGFTLLAETALPLHKPLDPAALKAAQTWPLRLRPGDDASCLNLYKAARPRIIGAPEAFIRRGGFSFAASEARDGAEKANPWLLLERELPGGAVPAIGDYNSVKWLMHSGLGGEIAVDGRKLRFVGLLQGSVFQSELIISETYFNKLYPLESGWRMFAIQAPPENVQTLRGALESKYEDFGLEATPAAERLNALLAVENTYLATFQALGGLGLLLGTLGLALALLRNLLERRTELAMLRALGYRRSHLLWLAVAENLVPLLAGMASGTLCALLAVLPGVFARSAEAPWPGLALTVGGVLAFALAATAASAAAALRSPLIWALKAE